jgi:hypothetical protein
VDRNFVYPGSIPLDTDILTIQRNILIALGFLTQATIGAGPIFDGLSCAPANSGLGVTIGPGVGVGQLPLDPAGFGSLGALGNITSALGCNLEAVPLSLTAPPASEEQGWLIQAQIGEADATPVVLPYWNSANPAVPFSGPGGNGTAQPTQRLRRVQVMAKAGVPAAVGQSTIPAADAGWCGLYAFTVSPGQTALTVAQINLAPGAPFIQFKIPQLRPGFSQRVVFTSSGNFAVPGGVATIRVRLVGGGGGGGGCNAGLGGGGGGAGGYAEGTFVVSPDAGFVVTVGSGGAGAASAAVQAGNGGSSSFGSLLSATGGLGGFSNGAGGTSGTGYGGDIAEGGGYGGDGYGNGITLAGNGGASAFGGGGRAAVATAPQTQALAFGAGGGGCYGVAGSGGSGASGLVIVEY